MEEAVLASSRATLNASTLSLSVKIVGLFQKLTGRGHKSSFGCVVERIFFSHKDGVGGPPVLKF